MKPGLNTLVYWGVGRNAKRSRLEEYDIIITTYNVVASEWKSCGGAHTSNPVGLFAYKWHRIVLDEGES